MHRQIAELIRSQFASRAVDFLFSSPIFATTLFVEASSIPRESALRILRVLQTEGLLGTIRQGSGRRAAILAFSALLGIIEA